MKGPDPDVAERSRTAAQILRDVLGGGGTVEPWVAYRELHSIGPAHELAPGLLVANGYQAARSALVDRDLAQEGSDHADRVVPGWREHPSRVLLHNSMLLVDGATHARMRRLAARAFTAEPVAALRGTITRIVTTALDRMAGQAGTGLPLDLVRDFAVAVPVAVICEILGIPDADRRVLPATVSALAEALQPGWTFRDLTRSDAAASELLAYFARLIAGRRAGPGRDLISTMIALNNATDRPLTDLELAANCGLLLFAGYETTANVLSAAAVLLAEHPEHRRLLLGRAGGAAVRPFLDEVLRYESPVQVTSRRAARDGVRVGDTSLAKDDCVIVLIAAANRDPQRFDDPDRFVPDRADNDPLSFGAGIHQCLGWRLAHAEAAIALVHLVNRFPRFQLSGNVRRATRVNFRGHPDLPVELGRAADDGGRPADIPAQ